MRDVLALQEVVLDEPLHRRRRAAVEDLLVNGVEVGIGIQLSLIVGERLHLYRGALGVEVALVAGDTVDPWIDGLERTEHVVERSVLHHENHEVTKIVEPSWRHSRASPRLSR